jgi:CRP-like cAMP-binding protein
MPVDSATARRNAVLDGLQEAALQQLCERLEAAPLPLSKVLYQPGEPVATVYFPLTGVVSIVAELEPGEVVEAATVGREGLVGISVFLGAGAPTERAVVQVRGETLTLPAEAFRQELALLDGPLHAMTRRYTQALFTQLARNAACNRVHSLRQRAARWLLMTEDRMASPRFELTQEFLAQMLAVRRASVSGVASSLAEDGCISYVRGVITVLDRPALLRNACGCYAVVRRATEQALRSSAVLG